MANRIKNCPFCGNKADLMTLMTGIKVFYCRNYEKCGAVVSFDNPKCNLSTSDEPKIEAWNRRVADDE